MKRTTTFHSGSFVETIDGQYWCWEARKPMPQANKSSHWLRYSSLAEGFHPFEFVIYRLHLYIGRIQRSTIHTE